MACVQMQQALAQSQQAGATLQAHVQELVSAQALLQQEAEALRQTVATQTQVQH